MVNDLRVVFSLENIKLAWQRIKTNPDRIYKNYYRPLYTAYAAAENQYLKSLYSRLRKGLYQPSIPTKIYTPKVSGILRPITLLSTEDQIVYQAYGNQIAIRLKRKMRNIYYTKVFGNVFAGARSKWFYKKWQIGYRRYNAALRNAFNEGYCYAASFDLTACYDSIDHSVLEHCLKSLNFSQELVNEFLDILCFWTGVKYDMYSIGG